jgi:hypothetical protein
METMPNKQQALWICSVPGSSLAKTGFDKDPEIKILQGKRTLFLGVRKYSPVFTPSLAFIHLKKVLTETKNTVSQIQL